MKIGLWQVSGGTDDVGLAGVAALCLAMALLVSGCRSTAEEGVHSLAAVTITGNTPGQISQVAQGVFEENGYQVAKPGLTSLVFEKKASGMSNLAYGNWGVGSPVWLRVKLSTIPVGEQKYRLQCQADLVRDRGSATEEEIKVGSLHRKPYQRLLDEVAKRLARP